MKTFALLALVALGVTAPSPSPDEFDFRLSIVQTPEDVHTQCTNIGAFGQTKRLVSDPPDCLVPPS